MYSSCSAGGVLVVAFACDVARPLNVPLNTWPFWLVCSRISRGSELNKALGPGAGAKFSAGALPGPRIAPGGFAFCACEAVLQRLGGAC